MLSIWMTIFHSQLQVVRMNSLRSSFINCNLLLTNRVFSRNRLSKNILTIKRSSKAIIYHHHLSSRNNRSSLNEWISFNARINNSWRRSLFKFIVDFIDLCRGLIFCFAFLSFLPYTAWFSWFWRRRVSFGVFSRIMKRKRVLSRFVIWFIICLRLNGLLLLCWNIWLWAHCHV